MHSPDLINIHSQAGDLGPDGPHVYVGEFKMMLDFRIRSNKLICSYKHTLYSH